MKKFLTLRVARISAVLGAAFLLAVPAAAAADRYVALGDSFSSGVGTGSYALSSSCKRSVYAYPYLLSQQRAGTSLVFVACSGATTSDLMANQIQSVDATTSIVTVTIGGNDIGFANLISQCTLADCSAALDSTRGSLESVLGSRLNNVYAAIKAQAAPGAKIVVLGYPHMFGSSSCLGTFGVTATERSKANQLADALDADDRGAYKPCSRRHVQECDLLVLNSRRLLFESLAERAEPVQHGRELPPRTRAATASATCRSSAP